MSKLQDMICQIRDNFNDMTLTEEHAKTLENSVSQLCLELSPKCLSYELQPFYGAMSKLLVEAIENQPYNDEIFSTIWNVVLNQISSYDYTNTTFMPVAYAAAKMGNIKVLKKSIKVLCDDNDDEHFINHLLKELLHRVILHEQKEAIQFLVEHDKFYLLNITEAIGNSIFELSANLAEASDHDIRLKSVHACLNRDYNSTWKLLKGTAQLFSQLNYNLIAAYHQWKDLLDRVSRLKLQGSRETVSESQGSSAAFDEAYVRAEETWQLSEDNGAVPILARRYKIESEPLRERLSEIYTAIKTLKAEQQQRQDENFVWLMDSMRAMQESIRALERQVGELKAENKRLQPQSSDDNSSEADKSSSITDCSMFGTSDSSPSRSLQKQGKRDRDSDNAGSYDAKPKSSRRG